MGWQRGNSDRSILTEGTTVYYPHGIFCVGKNNADHAGELSLPPARETGGRCMPVTTWDSGMTKQHRFPGTYPAKPLNPTKPGLHYRHATTSEAKVQLSMRKKP
jgi:hypothetical protein